MQTRFNQIKLRAWSFAILTVASFLLSIRVSGIKNPNVDIIGHTTGSNIQSDTINGHLISKSTSNQRTQMAWPADALHGQSQSRYIPVDVG